MRGGPRSKYHSPLAQTASLLEHTYFGVVAKNVATAGRGRVSTFFVFTLHRIRGRVVRIREAITLIFGQVFLSLAKFAVYSFSSQI